MSSDDLAAGFEDSALRPFPSSLRSLLGPQVEARHDSGAQFSCGFPAPYLPTSSFRNFLGGRGTADPLRARRFYGPAGSDFGQSRCVPRTKDPRFTSPGPAKYHQEKIDQELFSTKKRMATHVFSLKASWNEKQIQRLNRHRARQQDWPCSGNFNTVATQDKFTRKQYPRCHFGQSTTSRPFFGPLANSCQTTVQGQLTRKLGNALPGGVVADRRGSVRGMSSKKLL